ncbi:thioesterase II family protein [Kitasatospora sp. NBC_01302]|uniref:thioesterase II family protein n=1 Tax=Kitasatospora sp. NBC_01302 TaxID=2903575 RepID=UPI002E14F223|nr:alpha/beta fold hydrolase [Kitasatospora sp. NBC_01302]
MRSTENGSADRWFRTVQRCPTPRVRIICFPHAGGAASFFRSWAEFVPDDVELIAVRYPGREDRLLDPLAGTMAELADPIADGCSRFLDAPLALFGHSMGASVAYEVALRLRAAHGAVLAGLFVSSRPAPGREKHRSLSLASDDELIEDIALQGGTDARTFANPELRGLVLPAIRADYRLVDGYRALTSHAPLDTPVVAYYGDDEAGLDRDSVAAWSSVTAATFTVRSFDGGHFYLADHRQELLAHLFASLGSGPATATGPARPR